MAILRSVVLVLLLAASFWALSRPWGSVPAMGKLLDPTNGIWPTPAGTDLPTGTVSLAGLQGSVTIRYDDRGVPHIFAESDTDLYFAQGYVMARDRLWQMDFASRAAAGRLSEVLGERTIEYDIYQRRIGMIYGAEQLLREMESDPQSAAVANAFAAGINAWIDQLTPASTPFEYKLLGFSPEPWTNLHTALMFMNIRKDLSGSSSEHRLASTRLAKGDAFMDLFFGNNQPWVDPISPRGTPWQSPTLTPQAPDSIYVSRSLVGELPFQPNPYNGSNNWALSGSKTATGRPLLTNDPHLNLTLPAIWYEVQLVAPGVNVYGVTLAGIPGVTIGFNGDVAWGLTNVGSDVMDFLEITWKDSTRSEYLYDGQWLVPEQRTEVVRIKGQPDRTETVLYTIHGPVVLKHNERAFNVMTPPDHAMRWVAHDPSNELLTVYKLNRARNKSDLMEASSTFRAPAQNIVYATREGDIGIVSNGALPAKWPGQGKYPGDGSDPRYTWQGFIPQEELPQIHNPVRGFVSSANQHPAAPDEYPYYLDYAFAPFERGARINQRLEAMSAATPDSMFALLKDNYSLHAASILPRILEGIDGWDVDTLDTQAARSLIASWDYRHDPDKGGAALFLRWWSELSSAIWSDEYPDGYLYSVPQRDIMVKALLNVPDGEWVDDKRTPQVETLDDIIRIAFVRAVRYVSNAQGTDASQWTWVDGQGANINHLLNLAPLNVRRIEAGGCAECVNAFRNGNGPSWKMVVSLEDDVRAWGVYPGGQSGNPLSPFYKNNIEKWASESLYELLYLKSAEDRPESTISTLQLTPGALK